ncbi:hypothetical protein [Ktedonobacter sp. SOSP1-52]|uniref:hypothetical protein n=1 Tax=Ktedonobacter sp. SOSP1-52 TaxID=2778366 RepID=UPI0019162B6B|nr:hypothetical protein [Ktedonobacter sp. SOSP1-52]
MASKKQTFHSPAKTRQKGETACGHPVLQGLLAGAMGTVVLDIAGYADMALRGRPSSNTPAKMVDVLATMLHLSLSSQGNDAQDSTVQNRESGLGALLGYINRSGLWLASVTKSS